MPSVGPQNPTAAASTGTGDAWSNTGNVFTSNNARAQFTDTGSGSQLLKVTGFDFSAIPNNATINGIVVEIELSANVSDGGGGGERVMDNTIQLLIANTPSGSNKARTSSFRWPLTTSEAYVTYGSSTDLWGLTPTASDIKNSNFGVGIAGVGNIGEGSEIGFVDHVRMTVHYTAAVSRNRRAFFDF
jgi:hypothetical protein